MLVVRVYVCRYGVYMVTWHTWYLSIYGRRAYSMWCCCGGRLPPILVNKAHINTAYGQFHSKTRVVFLQLCNISRVFRVSRLPLNIIIGHNKCLANTYVSMLHTKHCTHPTHAWHFVSFWHILRSISLLRYLTHLREQYFINKCFVCSVRVVRYSSFHIIQDWFEVIYEMLFSNFYFN